MIRFGETEIRKEEFYGAKKPIKIWDIDVAIYSFQNLLN